MIVVVVKNPGELVQKQGWLVGTAAHWAGRAGLIDVARLVDQEVAKQLKAELAKQGVDAEVRVESPTAGPINPPA